MTANKDRGEISLTLEGVDYVLRPSLSALSAIEEKIGLKLRALAQAAQSLDLGLKDWGIVAAELIKAGAKEGSPASMVNPARLSDLIFEDGIPKAAIRFTMVLGGALTGGYTSSGEPKPIGTEKATTIGG